VFAHPFVASELVTQEWKIVKSWKSAEISSAAHVTDVEGSPDFINRDRLFLRPSVLSAVGAQEQKVIGSFCLVKNSLLNGKSA